MKWVKLPDVALKNVNFPKIPTVKSVAEFVLANFLVSNSIFLYSFIYNVEKNELTYYSFLPLPLLRGYRLPKNGHKERDTNNSLKWGRMPKRRKVIKRGNGKFMNEKKLL